MTRSTDDRDFRLDPGVRPSRYDAFLSVDPEGATFRGRIRIGLVLDRPAREIVVHGAGLEVGRATARAAGREHVALVEAAAASETLVVRPSAALPAGPAELELEWTGRFSAGLRGLYRAGPVAATQFEAADARRVFPCLDEPGFKAPWTLELEGPAGAAILSNGPERSRTEAGGRVRVAFAETPPLPTYLVALVVGPVAASPEGRAGPVPVRTWAVPEKAHLSGFGQEVALAVLPRLEAYFGLPYAFGKLDQVALPDFEFGAMENAGLVTYRETALLLDAATASLAVQKRVAEVVTHELAHQWFGNWVTMRWWDDLWLNESFATWMAYKVVDGWRPGWRIWLDFDRGKSAALQLDALRSTHPIRAEVRNPEDMGEAFDLITYEKGGAVLRMIEAWLGEAPFRDGIRRYMGRHARGNATADDLWAALDEASGQPVKALANAWIGQAGHPVVTAERAGATLRLRQRRFLSEPGAEAPGTWPVPVVVRFGDAGGVRSQRLLLSGSEAEVRLDARGEVRWAYANGGATGFYRVDPGAAGLAELGRHLAELEPPERVSLLSDEWALLRAGLREPAPFLDLLASFAGEADRAVLDELVGRLAAIEHRLPADEARGRFRALAAALLGPALAQAGWDPAPGEGEEERLRRAALVRGAVGVGREPAAAREAVARLDRFLAGDRGALEPNLHDAAVEAAARAGGVARFEQLRELFRTERDPAYSRRYLMGLALFEDPALSHRAQEMALAGDVPLQDLAGFAGTLLANRAAAREFWPKLRAAWPGLEARLAEAPLMLRRVIEGTGALTGRRALEELEAFFAGHPVPAARQAIAQTLERLRLEVALWERIGPAVEGWLAGRAGSAR